MIKKILLIILFAAFIFHPFSYAQTITIPMPTTDLTPSPAPTPVDYELPYPGILPGTPLYSIKQLRDKFKELMFSSAIEKSNFYLLQADKRLAASLMLYKNGDNDLASETLTKSQNYLEKSYEKMLEAKKTNENASDIYGKIKTSTAKQKQEIEMLMNSAKGEDLQKLKTDYQKVQEIQNKVNTFKP